jgi:glucose-1-phosphate thymidylyltransferase
MHVKGIILHGGKGTRLRPLTHTGPKQLIPIANKPMSQYAIEDLREAGITDIAIILGDIGPDKVKDYYGDGSKFNVKLTYLHQNKPEGIAHAIRLAREFVGDEPFVVYLGDNLLRDRIRNCVEEFQKSDATAHIALCHVKNPEAFGIAEVDDKGHILKLVEKPKTPPSDLALVGVYMFRSNIFQAIDRIKPSWRGELEITDAIQELMNMGCDVTSHVIRGWWKDTGKPEDILEANQFVLSDMIPYNKGIFEKDVIASGKIAIENGVVIKPNCTLRGPLIIGKDSKIGPDTYVGPYTSIGDNVVIKGGEIENSIILSNTIVECEKRIVDSLIGNGSKIVSNERNLPRGYKLIVGENTYLSI